MRDNRVAKVVPRVSRLDDPPFQTVLSACLPMLDSQAEELLQPSLTLNEAIKRVYDDVKDDELNHFETDTVLAYRVVNHSFIRKLLASNNKFLAKNMTDILRSILKDRNNATVEHN